MTSAWACTPYKPWSKCEIKKKQGGNVYSHSREKWYNLAVNHLHKIAPPAKKPHTSDSLASFRNFQVPECPKMNSG